MQRHLIDNYPFLSIWKIYMIPIIIVCFLNYLMLYAFYLDNHMQYVLNFFGVFAVITFIMSIMIFIGQCRSVSGFLYNYIFCKVAKFIISVILLILFLRNESFEYEYGLMSLGLIFFITQLCDNYIFLHYTDKVITNLYTENYSR